MYYKKKAYKRLSWKKVVRFCFETSPRSMPNFFELINKKKVDITVLNYLERIFYTNQTAKFLSPKGCLIFGSKGILFVLLVGLD